MDSEVFSFISYSYPVEVISVNKLSKICQGHIICSPRAIFYVLTFYNYFNFTNVYQKKKNPEMVKDLYPFLFIFVVPAMKQSYGHHFF